jgi:4-amino-4-deoxy-L-arabinose transferase-like glycosyltransferase
VADSSPTPPPALPIRWFHILLLAALVGAGTGIRIYRLGGRSLWMDEYWSLYLSTARGQPETAVFNAPRGVLLNPAPPIGFSGAPPWWHIWTGMSSAVHPPLYHIVLRWWVDCFGDSDVSVRGLSAVLGVVAALLLFEFVFRTAGPWPALLATALMLFSIAQIDFSSEARSYALLVFLGLLCCRAVLMIEQVGAGWPRILLLGFSAAAMALTHYFAAGFLIGLGGYVLLRLRGRRRIASLVTLAIAAVVVLVVWGPFFWSARHLLGEQGDYPLPGSTAQIFSRLLALPSRMILSPTRLSWLDAYPLAVLVFVVPPLCMRRSAAGLWWLWLLGGVGCVVLFDLVHQTLMVSVYKFLLPAGPAMYALVATPPREGRGRRWRAPLMIFICVGVIWAVADNLIDIRGTFAGLRPVVIYLSLIPLVLLTIAPIIRRSWPTWAIFAAAIAIVVNAGLLAIANLPPAFAVGVMLAAYFFLAMTAPSKKDCPWLMPLYGTILATGSIFVTSQWLASGAVIIPMPDWRSAARLIDQASEPGDPLVFTACRESNPVFCYIVYGHYSPGSRHPVVFLGSNPLPSATQNELASRKRVWMIGLDPSSETNRYFPGWSAGKVLSVPGNCNIWPVFPPGAKALDQNAQ